jgi:ABC-type glycerol-3-phosphate transport system substrate-binding protein
MVSARHSRRALMGALAAGVPVLAACGGGAASPGAAPTAAGAATAPGATAVPKSAGQVSGTMQVWWSANWNTVTDQAIGDIFTEWGKQNGVQVDWQAPPGTPQILANESAAVAAGAPPEIDNNNNIYWYAQGERLDVTAIVNKVKDKAGGMPAISLASNTAPDGKLFGTPYAIDPWPAHWRKDIIEPVTGGGFFKTWDDVVALGPKIQDPPKTYAYAMATGHEGDHVNNLVTLLWAYGGRLSDEKGVPDIKNPANRAGLEISQKLWKGGLVPPDSQAATTTSWNNESYQNGRGMIAVNPATIYGWLVVNDKGLADKTGLAIPPKGTAGQFAEAGSPGFGIFKKAKLAEKAQAALEYYLQPENVKKVSSSVEGRYVPVYRDHLNTDFWKASAFADLKSIAEVGRIREWPAPPQPWLADVTDAKYVLSDMLAKIYSGEMTIEKAQEWAQGEMMDSYNKFKPK